MKYSLSEITKLMESIDLSVISHKMIVRVTHRYSQRFHDVLQYNTTVLC